MPFQSFGLNLYQSINNSIMKSIQIILFSLASLYLIYSVIDVVFHLLSEQIQSDIRKGIASFLLSKVIDILPEGEFKKSFCQFIVNNEHKLNQ